MQCIKIDLTFSTGNNFNRYYFYPKIDYTTFVKKHINSTTA
ncbi:MAG: hypothetical protein AB8V05_06070 [Francisella endosymbiont of Hyalomma scupense]